MNDSAPELLRSTFHKYIFRGERHCLEQFSFAGTTVHVVRSRRRSIGLELKPDGTVWLRLPLRVSQREVQAFLQSKEAWLRRHLAEQAAREEAAEALGLVPLTEAELSALTKAARADLTARCERFAPLVGVDYGRISIRHQKTRWGSCSAKGNLNFNCLLMLAPEEVRDYVVVHELTHRREMNHSPKFWAAVEAVLPDYREQERWLKKNGPLLQRRIGN